MSPIFSRIAMIAALALPITSHAEIACKASYEITENGRISETKEDIKISPTPFGLIQASARIKNAYYSIEGYEQGNEFRVFIVDGNPPVNGAGIVMNATFNENNILRLSYVKGWEVFKVSCQRKK